jgi:uncharacterized protein YccT (UPF0319 family)
MHASTALVVLCIGFHVINITTEVQLSSTLDILVVNSLQSSLQSSSALGS